jgi:tetratricopeptide (TPR) repeat protein
MHMRSVRWVNAWIASLLIMFVLGACRKSSFSLEGQTPLEAAWNDYVLGEFDRAIERFEHLRASEPAGNDLWCQATYGLASTWNLRRPGEDPVKARELYEDLIKTAPAHDLAAWSDLALARMKHLVPVGEDPDYDAVRKAYRGVMARHPEHLAAQEAFLYWCSTLIASMDSNLTRQAIAELEKYVQDAAHAFVGPAWSLIAVGSQTLGDQERRLHAEQRSLETTEVDPTNPFTEFAWQYWNLATIAEFEVGDFETARRYYRKLIEEYPQDIRIFGAKQALKRMDEVESKIRAELAGDGAEKSTAPEGGARP